MERNKCVHLKLVGVILTSSVTLNECIASEVVILSGISGVNAISGLATYSKERTRNYKWCLGSGTAGDDNKTTLK